MKVSDFVKMEKSGAIFVVIDANKPGYLGNKASVIAEADRNVVAEKYGEATLVGFEPKGKKIVVYIKES